MIETNDPEIAKALGAAQPTELDMTEQEWMDATYDSTPVLMAKAFGCFCLGAFLLICVAVF